MSAGGEGSNDAAADVGCLDTGNNVEGGGNGCSGVVISGEAVGADAAIGVNGDRLRTAAVDALPSRAFSVSPTSDDMLSWLDGAAAAGHGGFVAGAAAAAELVVVTMGVNLGAPGLAG